MKYPVLWVAMLGMASLAMAPFSATFAQDEPGITFEYGFTSDIMMVAGVDAGANALTYLDNVDMVFGINTGGLGLWSGGDLSDN